jgi:hypothetical protein
MCRRVHHRRAFSSCRGVCVSFASTLTCNTCVYLMHSTRRVVSVCRVLVSRLSRQKKDVSRCMEARRD